VTEDEALLREMIVRMLRLEGYLVFEFGTAEATIETVDRHLRGVDLLISDIHLPQKDGYCDVLRVRDAFRAERVQRDLAL